MFKLIRNFFKKKQQETVKQSFQYEVVEVEAEVSILARDITVKLRNGKMRKFTFKGIVHSNAGIYDLVTGLELYRRYDDKIEVGPGYQFVYASKGHTPGEPEFLSLANQLFQYQDSKNNYITLHTSDIFELINGVTYDTGKKEKVKYQKIQKIGYTPMVGLAEQLERDMYGK